DFVKVYSKLAPDAYAAIVAAAKRAGLPVAGHVPRAVGLRDAVRAGQASIEHLTGFVDALQRDDSPVRGSFEPGAYGRKLELIDDAKLAPLGRELAAAGVWVCPTRVVITQDEPPDALRARLAAPEAQDLPPSERAIWATAVDRDDADLAVDTRDLALADRI